MRYWQNICIVIFLIVIYILFINFFASILQTNYEKEIMENKSSNGADVQIGMTASVGVSVIRKPKLLFFRTYESNGNSHIKLFKLVTIPKKIQGFNFIYFHIIFIVILIVFILNEIGKVNLYKEQPPY